MKKRFIFLLIIVISNIIVSCQSTKGPKEHVTKTNPLQIYEDTLPPFAANTIDGVLVRVGTESILLSDLHEVRNSYPQVSLKDALNGLIDEKIIEIKAKTMGIVVGEEELSRGIQEFLQGQNLTENDLKTELERNNKSMDEYREIFKKEMRKQQLIGRAISPFINVSTDEVSRFYLQQTKNVKQVEKVKLRSLVIQIPEDFSEDVLNYELVQKVNSQIKDKVSFVDLVRQYSGSEDTSENLGVLPPKNPEELPKALQEKLGELKIDEVVGPFEFGRSVFFFQYLGFTLTDDSDLKIHFDEWKNKLMNEKFTEYLAEYLRKERAALKVLIRPYDLETNI